MTREDLKRIFRHDDPFDAVGVINGVHEWRCFDFDQCLSSSAVYDLLDMLNLPEDYAWAVESGSHRGFHVWFLCDALPNNHGLPSKRPGAGVFSGKGMGFDHLELRWERCQTLIPPSWHGSGNQYRFLHDDPTAPPAHIAPRTAIDAFFEMTSATPVLHVLPKKPQQNTGGNPFFQSVKQALDPLAIFADIGWNYAEDGANLVGPCPLHESVSGTCLRWHKANGFFYCFHDSCGASGDLLTMIAIFRGCKPFDAAQWAASHYAPDCLINHESPPHPAEGGEYHVQYIECRT